MASFRNYPTAGEAHSVAAYLQSMGFDAVVFEENAVGGGLLSSSAGSVRIELPESQIEDAAQLLDTADAELLNPEEEEPSEPQAASLPQPPPPQPEVDKLFRFILWVNLVSGGLALCGFFPAHELPDWLHYYFANETLKDSFAMLFTQLWRPMVALGMLANFLCLFYLSMGRSLYVLHTILSLLFALVMPAVVMGRFANFYDSLLSLLANIALTLMYCGPLRARFEKTETKQKRPPAE